jgi:hypothetical protein
MSQEQDQNQNQNLNECRSCKFWANFRGEKTGICSKLTVLARGGTASIGPVRPQAQYPNQLDAVFGESFGCVLWNAKE